SADINSEWREFLSAQARTFSREIGELKGSLMKAGQLLSIYGEHFLPPEINESLKSLQQDSPPLKWEAMEPILRQNLSDELLRELDIDPEPVGTASLGQVHRALIKTTGEQIALKIQYPGVDKAIDSDLRALRALLNVGKILPKEFNPDPIFAEIRKMLVQETDYELEAQLTNEYRKKLENDKRFIVPKVYPRYSGKKILATSFEPGLRLDDGLVSSLQEGRRNRLATHFLDLYFTELFSWKFVQTDPHAGNYRVRLEPDGNDRIVLLDFGAACHYPDSFMNPFLRMIKATWEKNHTQFLRAAQELKFLRKNDDPRLIQLFSEFCQLSFEPFLKPDDPRNNPPRVDPEGKYDWKNTDLPQRSTSKAIQIARSFSLRTPPQEIIFLNRKAGGTFVILSILGAHFNGHQLLKSYLDKISYKAKNP
ncbi:MAG: AarF/ABC1/UbiB kinase family protein, partial [Bdellovibrionaceae bacterium]|nr:AarF/ABC1/UbiB kinase family protein [Pseudobdellovibrionaceae bacterium]